MKNVSIARRVTQVLAASVAITVVAILSLSALLFYSTYSARKLSAIARAKSQGSFELLDLFTKEQSQTQAMVQATDPDAIEALINRNDALRKQARTKISEVSENDPDITVSFEALVKANEEVKDLLLHARNAESRQAMVEKSNPAFEKLLGAIQKYQETTAQRLDRAAAQARLTLILVQVFLYLIVVGGVAFLVVYGRSLVRSVAQALNSLVDRVKDVAEGEADLTKRLEINTNDELGELARWFNVFMERLQKVISEVAENTLQLASASEEILATSENQAEGAASQTEQTNHVTTSMQEMSSMVGQISQSASEASSKARHASEIARKGGQAEETTLKNMQAIATSVTGAVAKVEGLGERSNQIGKIIQVIDEIARHTNLLALNAAIEASRAGDEGHGFAVVADEVRKLAKRTSQATQEITVMIHGVQEETRNAASAIQSVTALVEAGVKTNAETEALLEEIIQSAQHVGEQAMQIASATTQQSAATAEVNRNLERISLITAETANGAQMSTQACRELSNLAHNLNRLVGQFKLQADGNRNGAAAANWRNGAMDLQPGNEGAAMNRSHRPSLAAN